MYPSYPGLVCHCWGTCADVEIFRFRLRLETRRRSEIKDAHLLLIVKVIMGAQMDVNATLSPLLVTKGASLDLGSLPAGFWVNNGIHLEHVSCCFAWVFYPLCSLVQRQQSLLAVLLFFMTLYLTMIENCDHIHSVVTDSHTLFFSLFFFSLFALPPPPPQPQRTRVAMDPFSQLILAISVTSFLTFQWLFHKVSPWVSVRVSSGFLNLSDKQKVEWNSR